MNIFREVYTDKDEDVTPPMGATMATQGEVSTSNIPKQLVANHHTTVANIKDGKKISKMEALDDY